MARHAATPQPSLLTVEDVARRLNASVRTVHRYVADGELAAFRLRGLLRFESDDLERFLRNRRVQGTKSP